MCARSSRSIADSIAPRELSVVTPGGFRGGRPCARVRRNLRRDVVPCRPTHPRDRRPDGARCAALGRPAPGDCRMPARLIARRHISRLDRRPAQHFAPALRALWHQRPRLCHVPLRHPHPRAGRAYRELYPGPSRHTRRSHDRPRKRLRRNCRMTKSEPMPKPEARKRAGILFVLCPSSLLHHSLTRDSSFPSTTWLNH